MPQSRFLLVTLLLASLSLVILPAKAADDTVARDKAAAADSQEDETKTGKDTPGSSASSDSETILDLQSAIKSDTKNLARLKQSLKEQKTKFNRLSAHLKKLKRQLEKKKEAVQRAQQAKDAARVEALQAEIKKLEQDYELYKTQSDLVLEAEVAAKKQIQVLETKIRNDRSELAILKGEAPLPAIVTEPASAPAPVTAKPPAAPSPVSKAIPGMPLPVETTAPTSGQIPATPETAEQIAARREAQQKALEAKQAEQAIVKAVASKQALEDQIGLEKELLATAEKSLTNLSRALEIKTRELQELEKTGADTAAHDRLKTVIRNIKREIRNARDGIKRHSKQIETLKQSLEQRQESQEKVVEIAAEKQKQAEEARQKSIWLESPLHPTNVLRWMVTRGPRVLFVFLGMILVLFLTRLSFTRVANAIARRSQRREEARVNRANTLSLSFQSLARVIIIFGGSLLMLEEAGVDIKTVLGGAAIVGLAVAFGAQNLMRDYFTGFMIMLEDQYELGDVIRVGAFTGTVETVNMRTTVIRDLEGRVHFIPNGEIKQVSNLTHGWSRAVFEINVAYRENVDHVMQVLVDCANTLREDPKFSRYIIDEPDMLGVNDFGESGIQIKFMLKTLPDKMWPVRRELLRRIKNRFDEEGIELTVPYRIIVRPPGADQPEEPAPPNPAPATERSPGD